ncbi:MAG: prepilin-type N-terminal cleavage/methylation domain-containing protein [Nitrospirae bacterium]|nr:prepilin-type N-terminal cleavage/methylation domain-containing protein [Nitrospirota bacterium]
MYSNIKRRFLHRVYHRGYTLIEVIVATAIFSSMVLLATMALNQGLKQYHGLMERGINFWDNARHLWVNRSLSSAVDYYVADAGKWFPYFSGSRDRVSYISLAPLVGDIPVVVWIIRERQDNGRYSLVYYELPVYTKNFKEIERDYVFNEYKKGRSIKLLINLDDVDPEFYGYDLLKGKDEWSKDFQGSKKMTLPALLKFNYTVEGRKNSLMFRINTNSMRKAIYNEIYATQ